jgi:molecular chaperone DnaK (HSP70)
MWQSLQMARLSSVSRHVASGAAIQAGVLSGEAGDIVLVDVTPLTPGVKTLGSVATSLIARNAPLPVKHTETFTTAADMQTGPSTCTRGTTHGR